MRTPPPLLPPMLDEGVSELRDAIYASAGSSTSTMADMDGKSGVE